MWKKYWYLGDSNSRVFLFLFTAVVTQNENQLPQSTENENIITNETSKFTFITSTPGEYILFLWSFLWYWFMCFLFLFTAKPQNENQMPQFRVGRRLWNAAVFVIKLIIYLLGIFGGLHALQVNLSNHKIEKQINEGDILNVIFVKKLNNWFLLEMLCEKIQNKILVICFKKKFLLSSWLLSSFNLRFFSQSFFFQSINILKMKLRSGLCIGEDSCTERKTFRRNKRRPKLTSISKSSSLSSGVYTLWNAKKKYWYHADSDSLVLCSCFTVDVMQNENQSSLSPFGRRLWFAVVFAVKLIIYLWAIFSGLYALQNNLSSNTIKEPLNEGDVIQVIFAKKIVE